VKRLNPTVAGVRLSMLFHLYRVRLRSHAIQELLAGSGIAVGVALVLGVLVANTSLTGSASELVHQFGGSARLQLAARSPEGFDEKLGTQSRRLPGVLVAASVLRESIEVTGPKGTDAVQLLGATPSILQLGVLGARSLGSGTVSVGGGVMLPATVAEATGLQVGDTARVLSHGETRNVHVGTVLTRPPFGALASSPVAVAFLPTAQQLTGLRGRITQVYIKSLPGQEARVATELSALGGPTLDVQPIDHELTLLDQAAKPNDQSTSLFAAISVMVGFLLALNANLLTVPERRRFVADLRMQGYDWRQVLVLLAFQAVVLGLLASAVGVVLGDFLSHFFLHRVPAYLSVAFPVGSQEILRTKTILAALGCGVLATGLASLAPAMDLRSSRPTDAVLRDREGGSETISRQTTVKVTLACLASVALITVMVLLDANLTIAGGVALALSTLCAIPCLFSCLARLLRWTGERLRSSALIVVVSELRATTTRAVALAGIAALAVYGSVAIGGARDDLIRGLDSSFGQYLQTADIWVTTGGNDLGTTNSFAPGVAASDVSRAPGVASVRTYQGDLLDVGDRRMWIIGRPPADNPLIPSTQLVAGDLAVADERIRGEGWGTVSNVFATEHHLQVGATFQLPTPSGQASFRVAAITTNLGWPPGAVILDVRDFRRFWRTSDPTALEINLRKGVTPAQGRAQVAKALGSRPGLRVQTFEERQNQYALDSRQALEALSQIATLLLIAAALAVASALGAALWQRRARLASLKIQGYDTAQLWRALLLESVVVLGVGCAVGAIFGVYGHSLASRWLRISTGFPAPFEVGLKGVFLTLLLLAIIAISVISIPGFAAARAPAQSSFQE
jgi:putative ABC transport system permease protein